MKVITRPLAFVAVVTVVAVLVSGMVVVASALAAPPVTVAVHAKADGVRLWIPLPSLWLTTAARVVPIAGHVERGLEGLDVPARDFIADMRRLLEVLEDAEDAVLVQVEREGDLVEIGKHRQRIIVTVRSADADVDVGVPIGAVRSLVRRVERL